MQHVAIIMDGNGRWAERRGLRRSAGHRRGLQTAREIVAALCAIRVPFVTLYVFSTENWKRSAHEVHFLMNLIRWYLKKEMSFYVEHAIRVVHLGCAQTLPPDVRSQIEYVVERTRSHRGTTVALAINYGGKDEILRAVKKVLCSTSCPDGELLTEEAFGTCLDAPQLPSVDFLIRTGGQQRMSNFLLWQSAYAEFYFTDILWPDFRVEDMLRALDEYRLRTRTFGGLE